MKRNYYLYFVLLISVLLVGSDAPNAKDIKMPQKRFIWDAHSAKIFKVYHGKMAGLTIVLGTGIKSVKPMNSMIGTNQRNQKLLLFLDYDLLSENTKKSLEKGKLISDKSKIRELINSIFRFEVKNNDELNIYLKSK